MTNSELRSANRMRDINIQTRIPSRVNVVSYFRTGSARWVPEIRPVRVVDARAGTEDVDVAEFCDARGEHAG